MADAADVVVVGAGLAGLAASRRLAELGQEPLVLEARDRVGGRTLNESIGEGKIVEVGGQWVGPTQTRVLELIDELGLETFPTYGEGRNLFERHGRLRSYRGTIPRLGPLALGETGLVMARINRMANEVDPERPWECRRAADWDSQTFATWMRRHIRTRSARDLIRLGIWAVWAAEPEDVSLLHVLFYIRSAGSFEALLDAEGGAQESRVVGGTQLISLRMAEQLGDRVRLGAPVRRIEHGSGGVAVHHDGGSVRGRRVIVAMPPTLTARIAYDPPLPAIRDGLSQRMAQGSVVKCIAIYPEPFWRQQGLSAEVLSVDGPVSVTFDNSPPDGSPGVLLAFLEGRSARRASALSQDERRQLVLACLRRFFGERAANPERYIDRAWANEEFSRGCYGGLMPPGAWIDNGPALRAPVGPIHWAGAETASIWNGYMDGAIRSGERAAAEAAEAVAAGSPGRAVVAG
ncbi:MAG TPA: flavin monoamine oxidase family protein [Solirubrobacterales bacterium]|nr:flavin monoamine oxidase family protein [Solirubrobacterales bacterium]